MFVASTEIVQVIRVMFINLLIKHKKDLHIQDYIREQIIGIL